MKVPSGLVGPGGYKDQELNLSFIDTSVKPEFRRSNGDQDGYELRWGDSDGPKQVVWTEPTQERDWSILSHSRIAPDQRFSSGGPAINLNPAKPRTAIQGTYTVHTNFAGDAEVQTGSLFNYLPELQVVSPSPDSKVSKGSPLKVEWKPVSGAEAYYVVAYNGDEAQKMIKWSTSEHSERWWEIGFSEALRTGAFLSDDTTSVSIPTILFSGEVDIEVVALGYPQIGTGDFPITAWPESRCRFSIFVK